MSFDTPNISSTGAPATAGSALLRSQHTESARADGAAVTVDTVPANPPPEVLQAINAAARAYDRLATGGLQLHFHVDDQTGKVAVQVYDTSGTVLGSLSASQVLDIATSATLD